MGEVIKGVDFKDKNKPKKLKKDDNGYFIVEECKNCESSIVFEVIEEIDEYGQLQLYIKMTRYE
jgi:hypothetical protein